MSVRLGRASAVGACCLLALALSACKLLQPSTTCDEDGCPAPYQIHKPKLLEDPTMMSLAHDLDCVEKHIEWYGSVVAKTPDVWGQARLTKHREEFEQQMVADLGAF